MPCLPDNRDEFTAGKLGAGIFLKGYGIRSEAIQEVPENLRARVIEVIRHFDEKAVKEHSEEIAGLRSKAARIEALFKVPLYIRATVKANVINMYSPRKPAK